MTISAVQIFQRIASEIDNETVMMDKDFETYFGLEAIGSEVWKLLEEPISIEQVSEQFVQRYDVTVAPCTDDLIRLFSNCLESEMIVAV